MKIQVSLLIILIFNCLSGNCQNDKINTDFIILIDNEVIESNIYESYIKIEDDFNVVLDSIPFKYSVGDIEINQYDYDILKSQNSGTTINITFKYRQIEPDIKEYYYTKQVPLSWLNGRYIIFKVYNLENKKNRRCFSERKGYSIEIEAPGAQIVAPYKKNHKKKCR